MIVLLEVTNSQGSVLALPLDDPSNGFVISEIEGLDPVKATITSSSFAKQDGTQYQSSKRESRNIVLSLEFKPEYAAVPVRTLRQNLYDFFMPKSEVSFRFYDDDGLEVDISGRVEDFQSKLFVKKPKVDISIICFDPDFIDQTPVVVPGQTVADTTESLIHYDGSVETGFTFVLSVDRALTEFTLYHRPPNGDLHSMEFANVPLSAGDVLTISTISGAKGATLTRAGVDSSVLYGVSPQANWAELIKGDNHIRVAASGAAIPYTITYLNRYGGL